jgi:hypothetical protein
MVETEHPFNLYPNAYWVADAVLKNLGFPTSSEQAGIAFQASLAANFAFVMGNYKEDEFNQQISNQYSNPNPLRDLKYLSQGPDKIDIEKEILKVKVGYNQVISELISASPKYLDLTWQIYRRFGFLESLHVFFSSRIEDILNPKEEMPRENHKYVLPSPRNDEERVSQTMRLNPLFLEIKDRLKEEPKYRLVEFDQDYFYKTGRYALANSSNDIFQNIWDVRETKIPFFQV